MFDISWGKLVIIGVVALLVIGPKELPAVLRQLGQWMTKIRRMAKGSVSCRIMPRFSER